MPSQRRITLRDVAEAAGVSPGTISNYLNQTAPVHEKTQQKIKETIQNLGYQKNEIASSLRRNQTHSLGMIVPNVSNPFYAAVFQGAEEEAQKRGYTIALGNTHYDRLKMGELITMFSSKRVDGILLVSYARDVPTDYSELNPPLVVIEPPHQPIPFPSIGIDNISAARELVRHLIARGHRRIAIMVPSKDDLRYLGYHSALEECGLQVEHDLVYELGHYHMNLIKQGAEGFQELQRKTRFTALFASNDMLAIGAMTSAKENGWRIPADLAVVGFDDISLSGIVNPPLTTIAQPKEEMGRMGVDLLIKFKKKGKPKNVVLKTRLIIRDST